jgi:hypothetical protein
MVRAAILKMLHEHTSLQAIVLGILALFLVTLGNDRWNGATFVATSISFHFFAESSVELH